MLQVHDMEGGRLAKRPPEGAPMVHHVPLRLPPLPPDWCPIQPSLDSPASLAPGSPFCPGARKGEPAEGASLRPAQLPAQELGAVPTLFAHPNPKHSVTGVAPLAAPLPQVTGVAALLKYYDS